MTKNTIPTIARQGLGVWMAKGLPVWAAVISVQAFFIAWILRISYGQMVLPVILLSLPALFFGPMMYLSRSGGKLRLGVFMIGVVLSAVLFELALLYSIYYLGYLSQDTARELIVFIFVMTAPFCGCILLRNKNAFEVFKSFT